MARTQLTSGQSAGGPPASQIIIQSLRRPSGGPARLKRTNMQIDGVSRDTYLQTSKLNWVQLTSLIAVRYLFY